MNKVILLGRLGEDAEVRFTQGGTAVANFRVVTTESWMKDGERQERSEWHTCICWDKSGEALAKHVKKGDQILLEGSLQTRKWQDKEGNDRYSTEVKVDHWEFAAKSQANQERSGGGQNQQRNNSQNQSGNQNRNQNSGNQNRSNNWTQNSNNSGNRGYGNRGNSNSNRNNNGNDGYDGENFGDDDIS